MARVTRKRCCAEFKARVALEAIKGGQTLAELASRHGIHLTMIAAWKRQAIERMTAIFGSKADAASVASEADLVRLHARIGQIIDRD
jgi:transposase